MALTKGKGQIQYGKKGNQTVVELIVPAGTHLKDILKATEIISSEVLPKIGPVGCGPCLSGGDLIIREELDHVLPIDLATGRIG